MTTCRCIFQKSLQNRIPDFLSISISFTQFGIVGRVPLLLHVFSYQFRAVFPFEIELCHDRPTGVRNCCYCCHITTGAIVKTIHVTCPLRSVSVWLRCCFSFSCILYLSPFHFVLSLSRSTHAIPFSFLSFAVQLYKLYSPSRRRCGDICQQLGCWPKSQASIWSTWRQSLICFRFIPFPTKVLFLSLSFSLRSSFLFLFVCCACYTPFSFTLHIHRICWPRPTRILYVLLWSTASTTRILHNFPASLRKLPLSASISHFLSHTDEDRHTQMISEVMWANFQIRLQFFGYMNCFLYECLFVSVCVLVCVDKFE